jgi:hypothetical protein
MSKIRTVIIEDHHLTRLGICIPHSAPSTVLERKYGGKNPSEHKNQHRE